MFGQLSVYCRSIPNPFLTFFFFFFLLYGTGAGTRGYFCFDSWCNVRLCQQRAVEGCKSMAKVRAAFPGSWLSAY